jgi:DMSO/TMAO reductase YedYZ molybdopterin-dependent catalytic subunit
MNADAERLRDLARAASGKQSISSLRYLASLSDNFCCNRFQFALGMQNSWRAEPAISPYSSHHRSSHRDAASIPSKPLFSANDWEDKMIAQVSLLHAVPQAPALADAMPAEAVLDVLPGKQPLIKLSDRPPNYETPIERFRTAITPNDTFFVRYHLPCVPETDPERWKITVAGDGACGRTALSLGDLRKMPSVEVTAVNHCSGNRRSLCRPPVAGVQWGHGAMGCARWRGARLKDVLDKVGLKQDALEIVFNGVDGATVDKMPGYVKSLPVWKAIEETTLIAYEMNGVPLPHWHGFPARIIVPGWTGTYWVKHVSSIVAATKPFDGFWMKSAYRIPVGAFPVVARFISQETPGDTPITEMVVNSLITTPADGTRVKAGAPVSVGGLAWDGGYGIRSVEVSTDGGRFWTDAALGQDLGKYAFRTWSHRFWPRTRGSHVVVARATNRIGQTQTAELIQNPAGFHHNVPQSLTLVAT